jgi:SAM-dependent methyltransferase
MTKKETKDKKVKKPWPTKAVMEQVYQMKLWGGNKSEFYSGKGSHDPDIINPYIAVLTTFLNSFEQPLTVYDLGCGDFNVGKKLLRYTKNYIGVDIVPDLITHNNKKFQADNLTFQCLDIATADLPKGDCVMLRQVLQHLSNDEVQSIVNKVSNYNYVILTEHLPEGNFTPNKDIISGQGIRLKKQSGIDLLAAPFNLKIKAEKQLLAVKLHEGNGIIVTTLYTTFIE